MGKQNNSSNSNNCRPHNINSSTSKCDNIKNNNYNFSTVKLTIPTRFLTTITMTAKKY